MEYTIGIDLEKDERFERLTKKKSFLDGVFTKEEQEYLLKLPEKSAQRAAGIFCCKEAASKALGVGLFGLHPREICISHTEKGGPTVFLTGQAAALFPETEFSVSISHSNGMTTAVVMAKISEACRAR